MAKKAATKKHASSQSSVLNRRARFDYLLGEDLVVGIALTGLETRAARDGHVQLKGSFVSVRNDELWLNNASFSLRLNEKDNANARSVDTSPRKLLAKRKQIDNFVANKKQGMTIVPTKLLTGGRYIKLVVALGKGKRGYDKREALKRRDHDRDAARAIKY